MWALLAAAIGFVGFVCWMIFAGNDTQRALASELLETVVTGAGGFGIGWILLNGIRRFLAK